MNTMSNDSESQSTNEQKTQRSKAQRIAALLCVLLLVGLYLITLMVAIFDRTSSGKWFLLCLIGTVVIPLLTWIYIWMYGMLSKKHTIASFDLGVSPNLDQTDSNTKSAKSIDTNDHKE